MYWPLLKQYDQFWYACSAVHFIGLLTCTNYYLILRIVHDQLLLVKCVNP